MNFVITESIVVDDEVEEECTAAEIVKEYSEEELRGTYSTENPPKRTPPNILPRVTFSTPPKLSKELHTNGLLKVLCTGTNNLPLHKRKY